MKESTRYEDILKAVDYQLVVFADSLAPSKKFEKVANDTFQKVTESIRRDRAFSVNRCIVAGSYGKKTSVLFPDIDAVVFLNKKQHPLTDEIDAIVDLLKIKTKEFGIIPSSITKSSKTVKLEFYNGVEMDLLPACQFSQNMWEQYRLVLDRIKSYPENFYMYSSSLAEIQKQFLKDQLGSTHQLIRLLKYWFKGLTLDAEIPGGSYVMEIICVVVCNETEKRSLIKNFKAALRKVAAIDSLRVAFLLKNINNKLCWTLQTDEELEKHKDEFGSLILQRSNFIIDPSNPYNDLFNPKHFTDKVVTQLKECAEEMLRRVELLDSIESNELKTVSTSTASDTDYPDVKLRIDRLFEPQAMSLHKKYEELPEEIVFHVDFPVDFKSKNMSIDPKSPKFFVENKIAKKVSKTTLNNLLFLLRGKARVDVSIREKDGREVKKYVFANGIPDVVNVDDVKEAVKTFIQQNNFQVRYSSATRDHENCDVTLYVPYTCNDTNLTLRFSMKWKEKLEKKNTVVCGKNWRARVALLSLSIGAITVTLMIIRGR